MNIPRVAEIDVANLETAFGAREVIAGHEIYGIPKTSYVRARLWEYRRASQGTLFSLNDVTATAPYLVSSIRKQYVAIVLIKNGELRYQQNGGLFKYPSVSVRVIGNAEDCDTILRRGRESHVTTVIYVDADKLVSNYGLRVSKLPPNAREFFRKRPRAKFTMHFVLPSQMYIALDAMYRCDKPEPLRTVYFNAKCEELVCEVVAILNGIASAKDGLTASRIVRDQELIQAAAILYRSNLEELPTVEQLCHRLNLNRNKLTAGFREMFGCTPAEYARSAQLNWAKRQLQSGAATTAEIAAAMGYSRTSAFSRAYMQQFGHLPLEDEAK